MNITHMQEEAQEEFGWKLVHGDVFRPPRKGMLLAVLNGNGVQIFSMTFITLGNGVRKYIQELVCLYIKSIEFVVGTITD